MYPFLNVYPRMAADGSKKADDATMRLYGSIPGYSYDPEKGYSIKNTIDTFLREFDKLNGKFANIHIRLHTEGGSVYHGIPMYNAIVNAKSEVHTYNDGIAFSMGAVLLVAGKVRHAAANSLTLFHNASNGVYGNAQDFRKMADDLDKWDLQLMQSIIDRTGMKGEDAKAEGRAQAACASSRAGQSSTRRVGGAQGRHCAPAS